MLGGEWKRIWKESRVSKRRRKKKRERKREKKSDASLHAEISPSLSKGSWNFFTRQTVWRTSGSGDRYFRCFYGFLSSLRAFPPPIASVWWLFQRFYRPAFEFYDVVAGFYITTTGGSSSMSNDSIYTSLYRNISTEKRALNRNSNPFFNYSFGSKRKGRMNFMNDPIDDYFHFDRNFSPVTSYF